MKKEKKSFRYRFITWIGYHFFPKFHVEGLENLPENESCMIIGNHSQVYGPIACELYMKEKFKIWCAYEVMDKKVFKDYAYESFWGNKPKWIKWIYYPISRLAPIFTKVFTDAHTLPVYRGLRIKSTFALASKALDEGYNNILFVENYNLYNNIINEFKLGFVDFAKNYYYRTKRKLKFVPMYVAPKLKTIYLGKPIEYVPGLNVDEERKIIIKHLQDEITNIAISLPLHVVVPFKNSTKKDWPTNIPLIDYTKDNTNDKIDD